MGERDYTTKFCSFLGVIDIGRLVASLIGSLPTLSSTKLRYGLIVPSRTGRCLTVFQRNENLEKAESVDVLVINEGSLPSTYCAE